VKCITYAALLPLAACLTACGGGDSSKSVATIAASATPVPAATLSATSPTSAAGDTSAATIATASIDKSCGIANFQQEMLTHLNEARAASRMCGTTFYKAAGPLTWNAKLADPAGGHAQDMASNNYFSHTSQDGRSFSQRISATGYAWSATGENIAAGQATPEQVVNAWLQSPAHCENIMNGSYAEAGVACMKNDASSYKTYWVMELAKPR
jgi:uncharacterized protein YkwD